MASSRIAKFITEAAPPQYISVMRRRTSKMLDTISEEDRDAAASDPFPMSTASSTIVTASATPVAAKNSSFFLKGIQRSFSLEGIAMLSTKC
ncbi:hypothetical protein SADUNF_Sadunf11G0050500 [Salix dunnii]|uniref:Uncharacterized protein n=1 Tax=Salix dunnii TaxID=1413687 RepID=A0A835MMY3_9ROSI|nr:hypothetical protein SADUNF_Sadunf11G0050500 [Salix dunnii]